MADMEAEDVDFFFVKLELKTAYTLTIPAQTKEEAILDAYNRNIPVSSLYDVEKEVVKVVRMRQSKDKVQIEVLENHPCWHGSRSV
jgi:hypothetical protein